MRFHTKKADHPSAIHFCTQFTCKGLHMSLVLESSYFCFWCPPSLILSLLGNNMDKNVCTLAQRKVAPPSRIFLPPYKQSLREWQKKNFVIRLRTQKGVFCMITTPCEVINQTRDRVFHQILNVERATKHDANGSIFGKRCSRYKILW